MNRQMPVRSVVAVLVVSAGAGCALAWTVSQPDRHPLAFAFSLSWFVLIIVLFHVYPVMLQRGNRGRVLQLQQRVAAVKDPSEEHRSDRAGDQA